MASANHFPDIQSEMDIISVQIYNGIVNLCSKYIVLTKKARQIVSSDKYSIEQKDQALQILDKASKSMLLIRQLYKIRIVQNNATLHLQEKFMQQMSLIHFMTHFKQWRWNRER